MFINQDYWTYKDEENNHVYCNNGRLTIRLKDKKREREIGSLKLIDGKLHYLKRVKSEDIFLKLNAFGLCWSVISKLPEDASIVLYTEEGTYVLPRQVVLDKGEFLNFKAKGFEKQIFICRKFFESYKK